MKQNNELNIIINFLLFFGFWIFSCQSLVAKGLLLTESAVIESAKKHHPKIYITEEQIRLAEAKLQEALGSLAQRSGQIVLMTVGSSYDSTYFKKFANVATIVNTYSPTRDAMQVALERLD